MRHVLLVLKSHSHFLHKSRTAPIFKMARLNIQPSLALLHQCWRWDAQTNDPKIRLHTSTRSFPRSSTCPWVLQHFNGDSMPTTHVTKCSRVSIDRRSDRWQTLSPTCSGTPYFRLPFFWSLYIALYWIELNWIVLFMCCGPSIVATINFEWGMTSTWIWREP